MSMNKAKLEALVQLISSATQQAIAEYEKAGGDVPSIDSAKPHPLDDANDNIALKGAIRTLESACAQLCTTLAPPSHTAINFVKAYDYACLRVALRERITDILMDYPKGIHVNELSKIVNIDAKKLARLLRLLAARGCYNEVEVNTFANNRLSLVLRSGNPLYHIVSLHVETTAKGAGLLYETMKDPTTAYSENPEHAPVMYANNKEGITGTFFDWMKQDGTLGECYHRAMTGLNSLMRAVTLLDQFPFENYSTVVDVGGGMGGFSLALAKTHKHIKITLHDLPEVLLRAREVWERDYPEASLEERIEFAQLNFFTQAPAEGKDIYYLRNIIHDWPDHHATLILRNVRHALGPHSRVLIHDHVLPELSHKQADVGTATLGAAIAPELMLPSFGVGNVSAYQQDLIMWILHNAKERTLQNVLELSTAAGLKLEKVWDLVETRVLELSAA